MCVEQTLRVAGRLEMKRDAVAAGRAKIVDVPLRLDDHQMRVEDQRRESYARSPMIFGPHVMFGTKRPSMTSRCR